MSAWLIELDRLGAALWPWIIVMNLWAAVLVIGALVLDRMLARRVTPSWRMVLFGTVALRLVLPLQWESPLALTGVEGTLATIEAPVSTELGEAATAGSTSEAGADSVAIDGAAGGVTAGAAIALTYVVVVMALIGCWAGVRLRLARSLRSARPATSALQSLLPKRRLLETESVGPAVIGVIRPRIVVPAQVSALLEQRIDGRQDLQWILRHEDAHIRRHDPMLVAAMQLLVIGAWPILGLWVAAWRVRQLIELACDEHVLQNRPASEGHAYGRTLVRVTEQLAAPRMIGAPTHLGLLGWLHGGLPGRIAAIVGPRRRWPRWMQFAGVIFMTTALIACATGKPAGDEPAGGQGQGLAEQVEIRIWIIEDGPSHPKLQFGVGQTAAGAAPIPQPGPDDNRLTAGELEDYLAQVEASETAALVGSPHLLALSGQEAEIRVGNDDERTDPVDGYRMSVRPIVNADGTITIRMSYTAWGLETRPPASEIEGGDTIGLRREEFTLAGAEAKCALATGYIGAPMHVIALTARAIGGPQP